ncbi:MAG: alpha/beta hydrolase, partial [Actinomycetota bacterium]|nr:alpha/beta hydrolase [Actinomycetota bacterium]
MRFAGEKAARSVLLALAVMAGCTPGAGEDARVAGARPETRPRLVRVPNDGMPTRVEIGGYRLVVRCRGRGRPNVVLEAGYGLASGRWRAAQAAIAKTNRVCAYDRPGLGGSDVRPRDVDRTPAQELHVLLQTIRLEPPYVLAGHSLGGALAAGYAAAYPEDVLGLVLVDSVDPRALPDGAVSEGRSQVDLGGIAEAVREADSLRDLPIVVLERGVGSDAGWREMQAELAKLSSNTLHAVAPRSGHHIQASRPELV